MDITNKLKAIGDAIREKTGKTDPMQLVDMPAEIQGISTGGGAVASVSPKEVNFYDYDGTCLHAYTVEEAQALTELPPLPTHDGLICQGWNYNLETIKGYYTPVTVGANYITDDGKTRLYITLHDGRTSPRLGFRLKGTATIDWGDGTEADTITGTDIYTLIWTSPHDYANPGDYVISIDVSGEMNFTSSGDTVSYILTGNNDTSTKSTPYANSIKRCEFGNGVKLIAMYAFNGCSSLESITIPNSITTIQNKAFQKCYSLKSISIPNSITTIQNEIFSKCYTLESISIPNSITSISVSMLSNCNSLSNISIPNSVTSIGSNGFFNCNSLSNVIIPNSVTSIGSSAFSQCYGVRYYDFTTFTSVPTLTSGAFSGIASDCQMLIPAALYDEWSTATNWTAYASYMVAV